MPRGGPLGSAAFFARRVLSLLNGMRRDAHAVGVAEARSLVFNDTFHEKPVP